MRCNVLITNEIIGNEMLYLLDKALDKEIIYFYSKTINLTTNEFIMPLEDITCNYLMPIVLEAMESFKKKEYLFSGNRIESKPSIDRLQMLYGIFKISIISSHDIVSKDELIRIDIGTYKSLIK
jgi:hypothetical protein